MVFLFLFIGAWGVALLGWGVIFQRLLGVSLEGWPHADRMALGVLLGHIPVIGMGYLVHLALPLSGWPSALVFGVGWAIFLGRLPRSRPTWKTILLFAGVLAGVSLFCARPMVHGDTGGYHAQAILWLTEEPMIRGLANLMAVFGYNSSWWILAAWMSWPFGAPVGAISVSGPLLVATGVLLCGACLRIFRREAEAADWFWLPAFYLWLRQLVGLNTPSPTTDIPANLLVLVSLWLIVRGGRPNPFINRPEGRLFLALAFLAATAKLSASPLLAAGLLWLAVSWAVLFLGRQPGSASTVGFQVLHLLPLGVCGLAFLYHGWLLSGYPIFLTHLGESLAPPWQMPAWMVDFTLKRARNWAFTYGASAEAIQSTPAWKLWLYGQSGLTNLLIAGAAAGCAALGGLFLLKRWDLLQAGIRMVWLPASIAFLGLAWNLSQVPSLRFSSGFAFALLGCGFAIIGPHLPAFLSRISLVVWCLLCAVALSKLAMGRPLSLLKPAPPPPPVDPVEHPTKQGFVIRVSTFPWFAPKPAVVELEYDENLIVFRSPDGKILEMHSGRKKSY